jgi:hypothetical protein
VTKLPQYDYSYYVAADGAGRWFFGWTAYISVSGFNLRIQAGFTFNYTLTMDSVTGIWTAAAPIPTYKVATKDKTYRFLKIGQTFFCRT